MKKLGHEAIQNIIKRACKEFLEQDSAPEFVSFFYKDRTVVAKFKWSVSRRAWYLSQFCIVYSRCAMVYFVGNDYDMNSAVCW